MSEDFSMDKFKDVTLLKENKYFNWISSLIILLLIIMVGIFVYLTGGTTSFVHLMYIPIFLTVFIFGFRASILTSIIGGLVLGPYMPLHVSNGIMQVTSSWVFRIFMFILIAFVVDVLYKYMEKFFKIEKDRAYKDILTGLPNVNKFKEDFHEVIKENEGVVSLILFEFTNKDMINQYINFNTAQAAFMKIIDMAKDDFQNCNLYAVSSNQFAIILINKSYLEAYDMALKFSMRMKDPIYIDILPISVVIRGGIVTYPYHSMDPEDLMIKLQKTINQSVQTNKNIAIYNDYYEVERKEYYNTLVFLYHSLQNNLFDLAYQPKINICNKEVVGVEALLRLKNNPDNKLSIGTLISVAEDAGFINEITKWVIKASIIQIREWKDIGLEINVSINLSAKDIIDDTIINYTKECLLEYDVEPNRIEFELTERSIINDLDRAYKILNDSRDLGIKISLDDYGIGHNSLIHLVDSSFPYDYIKIDKGFIDNIGHAQNQSLIKGIIDTAHILNTRVVAEGVETLEQVEILNEIGCDIIQGYYYCKPIQANEIVAFMKK